MRGAQRGCAAEQLRPQADTQEKRGCAQKLVCECALPGSRQPARPPVDERINVVSIHIVEHSLAIKNPDTCCKTDGT